MYNWTEAKIYVLLHFRLDLALYTRSLNMQGDDDDEKDPKPHQAVVAYIGYSGEHKARSYCRRLSREECWAKYSCTMVY